MRYVSILCALLLFGAFRAQAADPQPTYVGDAACAGCHPNVTGPYSHTVHAKLFNPQNAITAEMKLGCEGCHGPASLHVEGNGKLDAPGFVSFRAADPETIEIENGVMVVMVQERPAIAQIDFVGLKEFDKDVIIKALKETGIAEGRIFDRAQLEKAEQELKRQYLTKGKYGVTITTTITPLERNRVGINFNIEEGASAKIKQINIVGAKEFSEKDLDRKGVV